MKKKIFTFMIILIFIISLSFVSASENDTVLSVSNDDVMSIPNNNISLQSNANDNILGQSSQPDNLLGDTPTVITVLEIPEGIIEDSKITLNGTLTDENNKPLKNENIKVYIDNVLTTSVDTDMNGKFTYDAELTTGFHYCQFKYVGQMGYASSQSEMMELAYANTNDLTDLVVRMVMSDGTFSLTKDYVGYGANKVVRRNVNNYGQIIYQASDLNKGIPISGNVVINGNGHTINVSSTYSIRSFFKLENAALTLNNMSLLNGYSTSSSDPMVSCKGNVNINLNNVVLANYYTPTTSFRPDASTAVFDNANTWTTANIKVNMVNSFLINNSGLLMNKDMRYSNFDSCTFINNGILFAVSDWYDDNFRNNIFLNNEKVFHCLRESIWEGGYITGNYWGTNDSSVINSMRPTGEDVYVSSFGSHTYLTVDGNRTFSEDDIQDYKIYFSGTYANRVPAYKTVLTYTSAYSTINATDITITSNPTTVRVSPKTYGLETLVIEPDLYELNINITKSTKVNYNVTVDAPETAYSVPLVITVNVNDADGNPVTTTANITIDGTTTTINITDGIGTLSVNELVPGNYEVTTKIISNMANYRNTTIYSSTDITKGNLIITLSCNTTTSIAREILPLVIKTQNSIGNNRSATVKIMEDGAVVGTVTTDAEGNGIFNYRPEAGSHVYKATAMADEYWESSESNQLDIDVIDKIPTKLTISSDTEMITEIDQKAKITVTLTDEDNAPLAGAGIKLIVNDAVVDFANTDNNGECEFEYTNTSGLYLIKAVYDGNLTHYDNSSEIIELLISTGGNFFDLSILINATNEGGVLTLIRDFTFNETLDQAFVKGIPINKNITIKGMDYTVNALNKARVFNINQGTAVTIDGLNVVNAASKTRGGAIYFKGDTLTISNSNFENNTITLDITAEEYNRVGGGAVYSLGALNVVNSTFSDNEVLVYNDAPIEFNGGGAIYVRSDINVYNSVFDSNKATSVKVLEDSESYSPYASSIYIDSTNAIIRNSTFKNGLSTVSAVQFSSPDTGNISIYDSLFLNNSASRFGALGILAKEGRMINTTFENNSANFYGAVLIQAKDFLLSDSRFFNNSANYTSSALTFDWGDNIILEKSYFINNHAGDGGTISYSEAVGLTVRYNIFVNNTGNASGVYYEYQGSIDDRGNLNYDYWGNNTPYDANVFNEYIRQGYDYITLEIIGPNVTYTTIPTTYIIKFNGTNADKLPNLETLIRALSDAGVNLDKSSITVNGSGATVVLTSDAVQNVTLVVGPEYNILNTFDIVVEQLIKKNYTSNITVTNNVYGKTAIVTVDILDENGDVADIDGFLTYSFNDKLQNVTIENGKAQISLFDLDAGDYYINFTYIATDLFYNDLTGNKTFDVSKANTTFTLDVNNVTYGEDVIIKATPQRGLEGNFTFYIEDVLNKTVEIEYGEASYTLKNLAVGNYTLVATFNGGKNYNSSTLSRNFTVSKAASKIEITIDDVNYGDEIIAFITGENVTGTVTVTVNNKDYTVVIENNAGNVTIDKLDVGQYNATVSYEGNENFTGSSNKTTFNVNKGSSNMAVEIGESILGHNTTLTVTFNDDVEGNVTVTVDGTDYVLPIKNGVAALNLTDLTEGNHTVNVTYPGNNNYNSSSFNTTFPTRSLASQINVTASGTVYGGNVVVTATVTSDATGDVEFTINNVTKTGTIKDGVASATFEGLNAGQYNVTAKYLGDSTYISSTNTTTVTVSKANSTVIIEVGEIKENENIVITFTVLGNATGNVTVEIPGLYTPRTRNLTDGVYVWTISPAYGNYTVKVTYNGDDNYLTSSNSTTFAAKYKPALDIVVSDAFIGDDYTVDVILNSTATGTVLITVDGKNYNRTLKNGKASVTLKNLTAGSHTVDVVYSGDAKFYNATGSKTFEPKSVVSSINVTAADIVYGNNLVVKATVSEGATGNVTFTVNGTSKTVEIKNGIAEATFSGVNAGSHTITAKYLGDMQHTTATNTTDVVVSKVKSYVLIDVGEIKDGENVIIRFTVPSDATGNITVEIPGLYKPRNINITNGIAKWNLTPLKAGTYTVNVVYNGDNNYLTSSNSTTFAAKSKPALDIVVSDAFIGDDYTVDVILNSTATGTVLITVDGVDYNRTLNNGKASVTLKNLTAGSHTVDVVYSGDAKFYNATGSKTFEPKSVVSSINVTAADIVYGNDLVVKATVTAGAEGNVEFTVNGVTKTVAIKNGVAQVSFSNLNAGSYEVTAKYLGDRQYTSATNTTTAKVKKASSFVLIDVGEIKDGENVVIRFTLPSDATGNLTVEIPGLYSARNRTVTNGAASWTIAPLKPGTYTLNVVYNGDKNYLASSNSTVLISKDYADIDIDVGETIVGQNATIGVVLPKDATGSVLITVDGVKYNKTLKDGRASVTISDVTKGTHTVEVIYSGDKHYYSSSNSTTFEPKSLNSTLNVIASDIDYGENLVVRAVVNEDATGTVKFTVNGEDKTVDVHQGFASASFTNVNAGNYVVKAVYSGDEVYLSSSNTTGVRVNKANSTIAIKVGEIKEGQNVVITFIASNKATGNITVEIPGLYSPRVRTLANNENRWIIAPLSAGLYEIRVSYDGDINYYGSSNSTYIDYNRVKTTLDVDVEVSKTKVRFNAKLSAEDGQLITAWVNITVGDSRYRIPVYNGTGYLDIPRLNPGNYTFEAFYPGTRAIINSSDSGSFEVDRIVAVLNVPDVVKYYGGSERLYVYLKDSYNGPIANGTVVITINGMEYTRTTNANGTTSMPLGLNSGLYEVTVVFDDKQYGSVNATSTANIKPTVNGTDLVKVYRNATQYYATFRDSKGNYLPEGTTVRFNINGVFYDRKISGDKGLAKLNINLEQGSYILTAMNPVTGENAANNITVISRLVENNDLTKYYRNASQYTVKVIGDDGKPVGAGATVTFNINGVFYQRQTNASGIAKLSINLEPGDYIITAEYGGCRVSNKIKVLPVLSAKDMAKKYGTSDPFVATLVDGQGKPYAGQTVQFNINGVFYNRVTNSYGQARLNINLQPGQYIITSSYNGLSIANKVTVTP